MDTFLADTFRREPVAFRNGPTCWRTRITNAPTALSAMMPATIRGIERLFADPTDVTFFIRLPIVRPSSFFDQI